MKTIFLMLFMLIVNFLYADVYVVIYTTQDGVTGHAGIAVDNYSISVTEKLIKGVLVRQVDTIKDGTLTFYDLWPEQDIPYGKFNKDTAPRYNKLPRSSAEKRITVASLLDKGLPHKYRYPCDGLIQISTAAKADMTLMEFLEKLPDERPYYNARKYNCVDFVALCLEKISGVRVKAKEFIPMSRVSTPNKLFLALSRSKKLPITILRKPGAEVGHAFFVERILK